ncbi:putative bifunctional diguanylate cyclase/phosphodiesterase [Cobetia crustatorum]|uniref:putative bifunctional diguanylate cyclase/phosphodiesterase n=1 Tax=Cobetia crustatorum TaxID=553385 RepID=UPI000A079BD2|nr:GGDEF domain-containing phosphodiesterase [Cobetia crustatorum]
MSIDIPSPNPSASPPPHLPTPEHSSSRLRWRIIRLLVPIAFSVCALLGLLILSWHIDEQKKKIHTNHLKALEMASLSLPAPIWNFDHEVVDKYLTTLQAEPTIHATRLYDTRGKLLVSLTDPIAAIDPMTHSQMLIYSNSLVNQSVGRLEIDSTYTPLLNERNEEGLGLLLIVLGIVASVSLLLLWQMHAYVLRPLDRAVKGLHQIENSDGDFSPMKLSRTREINGVILQLNQLGSRVTDILKKLRDNEQRYQHFYRDTPALLLVIDEESIIQDASQLLIETSGWTRHQLIGVPFHELLSSQNKVDTLRIETSLRKGKSCNDIVMDLNCKYHGDRQVQLVIPSSNSKDKNGSMLLLTDITELLITQQRLLEHELIDPLTRLPNRLALNQHLQQLITTDSIFSLLMINIDRFHSINHHLGPDDGDRLLVETGERLKSCHSGWMGRIGGDEFIMTCEIDELRSLTKRIEEAFSAPLLKSGELIHLSLSMAGLEAQIEGQTPSRLMRMLERTMIDIKHGSGNQYRACIRDSNQKDGEALFLQENMIREALTMRWFTLYLQPIYLANSPNLDAPELLGAEVLIRLEHPELGLIPPNDFIPAAEKTGQIIEIGNWVLEEAAVILCEWQKQGFSTRYLSVNASVVQFRDHGLLHQLESLLERYPINPTKLVIEVTENLMLNNEESLRYQLKEIRKLGVNLSLDDFGTGFSCLSYLHELPFGTLKIDRSFVMNVETNPRDKKLARVIVDMASSLGMQIVVEGIEQRGQAEIFQAMGVRAFQGYHFARPMPQKVFEARFSPAADTRLSQLRSQKG